MSAAGAGGCGPGPGSGAGSGASNPRKFSEKIALHTQRQAEETAAFQEVMMDISSTRLQAQKARVARTQGPYYGGSLPNVNQIGSSAGDFQGPFLSSLDSSRGTRHHGLVERVQRDRRFMSPLRHYRRQIDSSPYSAAYLSPPPDASWRRNMNWSTNFLMDKGQFFRLPSAALNRTNSDSALHTSVMNPNAQDAFGSGPGLAPQNRHSGLIEGDGRKMFHYPVPPIEENILDDGKQLLKPWDTKKVPMLSSRPKSCEVPGINIFPSPDQQASGPLIPSALNTGGSLPDLSSLHFPSPLPTPLDPEEPPFPSLSGGSSTGNLASTLTQLGINPGGAYHSPVLSSSLQGNLSNPTLQSSLSNPNIQSSLSSHSFQSSLSSASLHSSLSNPSLQSSLSSSPSLQSSFSNQSLQSSLSNSSLSGQSIQSSASNPSYSSGVGSSASSSSSSSSYTPPMSGQQQLSLSTSPRRRAQLSPLILPMGGDSRRHHVKQFSPTISPTLSSITQGVPLDTSKLPPYPYSQGGPQPPGPPTSHQPLQKGGASSPAGQLQQQQQQQPPSSQHPLHPQQPSGAHLAQSQSPLPPPGQQPQQQHAHLQAQSAQGMRQPLGPGQNPQHLQERSPLHQQHQQHQHQQHQHQQQQHQQHQQHRQHRHGHHCSEQQPHPSSQSLAPDFGLYNDSSLLNSLLDDPYLDLQLTAQQTQVLSQQLEQFNMEGSGLNSGTGTGAGANREGGFPSDLASLAFSGPSDPHVLNKHNQSYGCGVGRHGNVPNIILTGDSPPGLSKEITSALAGVPGFEVDPFSLDDSLALEGLGILADGDLMLPDPSVEDSFRSDRLK